ncbi:putative methyltransferase-domain-containing protein [Suillus subaureus]|uniref:Protein N-terminal and lysine N-methyltransferase EFM7 n=1 Tax=Suillus subaureus TaxID=48587 RepID=A0A9P7EKH1_9AGAM|nr:putative methyltransferase-domain-containing protein [Suillus subaureus]KAG1824616.1 putative methyltransferase-domain-containing protein [Suillus subaureus]
MQDGEDLEDLSLGDVFTEPPRPPTPPPTFATCTRNAFPDLKIRLVGSHPLWAHHLWNAALAFASYIDSNPEIARNRCVLELGAGGGLPGLVAAQNGAKKVVLTDYPEAVLIDNLEFNASQNLSPDEQDHVETQGYIWGHPVDNIMRALPKDASTGYHLIILSDLIFNHSQHDALLKSCDMCLTSRSASDDASIVPCVLVFYSHHRPHLADRDLEFFRKAQGAGWVCEEIVTHKYPPMFPEDPGEEKVRATVHGWRMTRGDAGDFPHSILI